MKGKLKVTFLCITSAENFTREYKKKFLEFSLVASFFLSKKSDHSLRAEILSCVSNRK